jgi:hypothetical protein
LLSQHINGKSPCDLDISGDNDLRNRASDGQYKYFFIKNQGIKILGRIMVSFPGFDTLGQWNLTAVDLASAAYASLLNGGFMQIGNFDRDRRDCMIYNMIQLRWFVTLLLISF